MSEKSAKITIGSNSFDLPMIEGTMGYPAMDARFLNNKGIYSYDPGFTSTASCTSGITYVDGDKGELLYRGYPIEQLAEKSDFLDVSYLLFNGNLPNTKEKQDSECVCVCVCFGCLCVPSPLFVVRLTILCPTVARYTCS